MRIRRSHYAVIVAGVDRGQFWKRVKKSRKSTVNEIAAIKASDGKVFNDKEGILSIWKSHFENCYTPKVSNDFDEAHLRKVTKKVAKLNTRTDSDEFQ